MAYRFFVDRDPFGIAWEIRFGSVDSQNRLCYALPIQLQMTEPNEASSGQPMIRLSESDSGETLQSLMDELWKVGIRPKDIGTAGHLSATQKHLEDMRAIVSSKLEVKLP